MPAIQADDTLIEILDHMQEAQETYGDFASTHEALGVALEEWEELKHAVQYDGIEDIRNEAIDLAAVLIRLANQCRSSKSMKERSVKQ